MKLLKYCLLLLPFICAPKPGHAQMTEDPTTWKYEVKKKSATEYQLIFHVSLKKEWHIWSVNPGGDGYEIPPTFTFDSNPKVKLNGKPTEKGKAITTTMEGIDGKLIYLTGEIAYIQNVTVTGKTIITGKHQYQVCNNRMCLPPKDKNFSFEIK